VEKLRTDFGLTSFYNEHGLLEVYLPNHSEELDILADHPFLKEVHGGLILSVSSPNIKVICQSFNRFHAAEKIKWNSNTKVYEWLDGMHCTL
jgi:hypothetical protein